MPRGRPAEPAAFRCRSWEEDNRLWVQEVSSVPSTRLDVVQLQEQLDLKLQQRQARETGICPVRRELYSQCFGQCSWHPHSCLKITAWNGHFTYRQKRQGLSIALVVHNCSS